MDISIGPGLDIVVSCLQRIAYDNIRNRITLGLAAPNKQQHPSERTRSRHRFSRVWFLVQTAAAAKHLGFRPGYLVRNSVTLASFSFLEEIRDILNGRTMGPEQPLSVRIQNSRTELLTSWHLQPGDPQVATLRNRNFTAIEWQHSLFDASRCFKVQTMPFELTRKIK